MRFSVVRNIMSADERSSGIYRKPMKITIITLEILPSEMLHLTQILGSNDQHLKIITRLSGVLSIMYKDGCITIWGLHETSDRAAQMIQKHIDHVCHAKMIPSLVRKMKM